MTDRERCYGVLSQLKEDGFIADYIASQRFPNRRRGFRVTMADGGEFMFLPREVLAFDVGIRIAQKAGS